MAFQQNSFQQNAFQIGVQAGAAPQQPANPLTFADGNSSAHVAGMVGVIGFAAIFAAEAALFAIQPQLTAAEYQHGTHAQHHAQASQYATTFGRRAAHEQAAAATSIVRPLFARAQEPLDQAAARIEKVEIWQFQPPPIRPFEAAPQASPEQVPAKVFGRSAERQSPPPKPLYARGQDDQQQPAAVTFHPLIEPPPEAEIEASAYWHGQQQKHIAEASQYAQIFRVAQYPGPAPQQIIRPIAQSRQDLVEQPAAVLFHGLPVVAPPIRPFEAGPQSNPEQPAPIVRRTEIWQFQAPPLRPTLVARDQDRTEQPAARVFGRSAEQDKPVIRPIAARGQDDQQAHGAVFRAVIEPQQQSIVRPVVAGPQQPIEQIAPLVFGAHQEAPTATPRTVLAGPQSQQDQVQPQIFGQQPPAAAVEATPTRPFFAGPQASPEQFQPFLFRTELPSVPAPVDDGPNRWVRGPFQLHAPIPPHPAARRPLDIGWMFRQPERSSDDLVVVIEGSPEHAALARREADEAAQSRLRNEVRERARQAATVKPRPQPSPAVIEAEPDPSLAIAIAIAMLEAEQ